TPRISWPKLDRTLAVQMRRNTGSRSGSKAPPRRTCSTPPSAPTPGFTSHYASSSKVLSAKITGGKRTGRDARSIAAAIGGRAALDACYDVKASGVTLDRFCGSGITATNLAAGQIMSGMEDLVIAGGTEMMSHVMDYGMKLREAKVHIAGGLGTGNMRLQAK